MAEDNLDVTSVEHEGRSSRPTIPGHRVTPAAVKYDDDGEPVVDERDRTVYRTRKHDLEEFACIAERYPGPGAGACLGRRERRIEPLEVVFPDPGPAVFLHHFLGSDLADEVHSHPWTWAASVILVGSYQEHRCDAQGRHTERTFGPGDINVLEPHVRHRIELVTDDCWTLVLAGEYQQSWTFFPSCGL